MATESERKLLEKWFKLRFKESPKDNYYFEEWVDRFNTGHIERYMDSKSKRAWKKVRGMM